MNLTFSQRGWTQYTHWQATDAKMVRRINGLITECLRHPFEGTGKLEPLRGELSGFWSRRIDREHRLVYEVTPAAIMVVQCRFHY